MRCITSALTKAALVGIMAVSTVKAQQSGPVDTAPVDQIASSNKAKEGASAYKPLGDPVYGVSSARGARYLLRNGLDYLSYGEYQRALKFLRETESRKNELNDAENLVLQKSIENAQRGLRDAADAETPYAISDQVGNRHGFNPAKPDTQNAGQQNWPRVLANRKSMFNQANVPRSTMNNSDDQGEPIRLARGDDVSIPASSHYSVALKSSRNNSDDSSNRHASESPRPLPEIPELPRYSQELRNPATKQPNITELAQAPNVDRTQNENLVQTAVDPGRQLPIAAATVVSDDPTVLLHTETEDVILLQMHKHPTNTSLTPAAASISTPVMIEEADHIPPSKTDQDIRADIASQPLPTLTTRTPVTTEAPVGTDKLPPLPTNLSESAAPPHSELKSVLKPTVTSDSHVTGWTVYGDQPSLLSDLGHPASRSVDESVPSPESSAIQNLTTASQIATPNVSIATPNTTAELSPRGIKYEETEPLPPLPAQDESIAAPISQSAEALPSLAQLNTVAQSVAAQPRSSLGSAKSSGLPLNSASIRPNPESAQEVVASLSRDNDALEAPPLLPPEINTSDYLPSRSDSIVPSRPSTPSALRPELKREVETIARKQEDELRRRQQAQPPTPARDTIISDLRAQTQLDISRAPSPAEARPIKAIPVPEDWVSLAPRNWSAQHKYWAAAATCHLPLYFQDPVLERYGHSVEQFVGPIGRYLTYPLDAPAQSTQRNQILQPLFSAGLFAFQIAALPYNAIVDPPWEAQYDLGYYRPGDVIPTDIYWLPLHGFGPPLQGSNY